MARRGRPRGFDRAMALEAAMRVFWERGYDSSSLATLAAEMGVSMPSLYAAFGSKEALFREAVELYDSTAGAAAERALLTGATAEAGVEAMLRSNADMFSDPGTPSGCLIVLGGGTWMPDDEPVAQFLSEHRRTDRNLIADRIRDGAAAGELPTDSDADSLAAFFASVINGMAILARDGASRAELHAVVDLAMTSWP